MTVRTVSVTQVRCDQLADDIHCHAYVVAGQAQPAAARDAARLRGWSCDDHGDRCPSHSKDES